MAFKIELGGKSSGNMTLLQAGSTAVPGNLPAAHLSLFILFLQGGWPWALYLGQSNWLQGKTWPWPLWERWAKEHPLKHLDSWHIAPHINHTRSKNLKSNEKSTRMLTCWLFLFFETAKKCFLSTTTAIVGIVTSKKVPVWITMTTDSSVSL